MKHTIDELRQWQSLPLSIKERMSMQRIRDWVHEYGEEGVYISYSGGKDSTVLSHLVDRTFPGNKIPRLFVDTGLEYPEIRQFARQDPRCVFIKPKMNFRQVIEKHGYPLISKEVSEAIEGAQKYLQKLIDESKILTDRQTELPYKYFFDKLNGTGVYAKSGGRLNEEELATLLSQRMKERKGGSNQRLAQMLGWLTDNGEIKANIPSEDKSAYSQERYKFFLRAPFKVSNKCCNEMKKKPAHEYSRKTGRVAMTGEMADESRLRTQKWLQNGCNGFDLKYPKSTPMAFWTNQDVLKYIKENQVQICSVYGEIAVDYDKDEQCEGQMCFGEQSLKTTGCKRTGCMFCGFGCHLEKEGEGRFELLKKTHPQVYDYIMRPKEKGGLNYKEVIDWINQNGDMNIRY